MSCYFVSSYVLTGSDYYGGNYIPPSPELRLLQLLEQTTLGDKQFTTVERVIALGFRPFYFIESSDRFPSSLLRVKGTRIKKKFMLL